VGGNGAIAALIFGIVLGNSEDITSMLKLTTRSIDKNIKNFQNEISFLVKTFFFVYLGILFQLEFLTPIVIVISVTIIIIILFARYISTSLLTKVKPLFVSDQKLITTMSARGLAAAVLVSIPVSMGLTNIPNTPFTPEILSQITAIAFLVIFFSNILTTLGLFISEGGKPRIEQPDEREKLLKDIKVGVTKPTTQKRKRAS
jgi:cell volume regulation protein A